MIYQNFHIYFLDCKRLYVAPLGSKFLYEEDLTVLGYIPSSKVQIT